MLADFLQEQKGREADGRFVKGCSGNSNGWPAGWRNNAAEVDG